MNSDFGKVFLAGILSIGASCLSADKELAELRQGYDAGEEERIKEESDYRIKKEEKIRTYVENHLGELIKLQEERFGIKHFGVPEVRFLFNEGNSLRPAKYDCLEGAIYIYSLDISLNELEMLSIDEVLNHELGHFYADKLNEELRGVSFPIEFLNDKFDYAERIGIKLVSEGIAESFRLTMKYARDDFWAGEFPGNLNSFAVNANFYPIGLSLVNPMIKEHGVMNAVAYLTEKYPATLEDILDLGSYQRRAMDELEKSKITE